MFTIDAIRELQLTSAPLLQKLKATYALLPATQCQRHAHCCSMLPEATLLEVLTVIDRLGETASAQRKRFVGRIIKYFFLNAVKITSCPFLVNRDCIIYPERFLGCRAYGLWSQTYYQKLTAQDRQAKYFLQQQWKKLGISLPQQVVDFNIPYCRHVKTQTDRHIDDRILINVSNKIEALSSQLGRWHHLFHQQYNCDFSFLLSALAFGLTPAVEMKFEIVKEIINTGNKNRLKQHIQDLPNDVLKLF